MNAALEQMTKTGTLYLELRGEIAQRQAGDRFWSIREIMKRYGVSQLVVDRTIGRLRSEGLLEAQPGRGIYVANCRGGASPAAVSGGTIMVMTPRWVSVEIDELNAAIDRINAAGRGYELRSGQFDFTTAVPRDLERVSRDLTGLIILPAATAFNYRDILALHAYMSNCRTVVLARHLEEMAVPCIGLDDNFAGHLAAHHLAGHGHSKLGILLSEPPNRVIMNRVRGVEDYCRLHGIGCRVFDCRTRSGEAADASAYRRFSEAIAAGLDITGLVGVSGDSVSGAVNACHNHGIRIPDRLSVVAIACEGRTATYFPPLDTVGSAVARQLEMAVELIVRPGVPAEEPSQSDYYLRPELIERGSVADIADTV